MKYPKNKLLYISYSLYSTGNGKNHRTNGTNPWNNSTYTDIGIWIILCGDCYHPLCSTEDVNKTFNFIYEILTELTSYNVA